MTELFIAVIKCHKCSAGIEVGAVKDMLKVDPDNSDYEEYTWIEYNRDAELAKRVQQHLPMYRMTEHAYTAVENYYANHCPECGFFTGDFPLIWSGSSPFLYEEHKRVVDLGES